MKSPLPLLIRREHVMRHILLVTAALAQATPALAQNPASIPSSALSRCAGNVGTGTRRSDPAFGAIMLDGKPWTTIERSGEEPGASLIDTTMIGTGALGRRNGTLVTFRFTCEFDTSGQALTFHARQLLPRHTETSELVTVVAGSVSYAGKMALPHGAELRVQLVDATAQSPDIGGPIEPVILTEQVVRRGWGVPIPFALYLPTHTAPEDRRVLLMARLVLRHQSLFQLKQPYVMTGEDLHSALELVLDQAPISNP
jgi:uncharacterized lipoprotein YbaY